VNRQFLPIGPTQMPPIHCGREQNNQEKTGDNVHAPSEDNHLHHTGLGRR